MKSHISNTILSSADALRNADWEILDGDDWRYLLSSHPQFADYCKWDKLDGTDWRYLVSRQPQFKDKRGANL